MCVTVVETTVGICGLKSDNKELFTRQDSIAEVIGDEPEEVEKITYGQDHCNYFFQVKPCLDYSVPSSHVAFAKQAA